MPKRKMSWAIVAWNVGIALWIFAGLNSMSPATSDAEAAGQAVGAGIAITAIIVVAFMVNVLLALLWFGTRPKSRA